MEDVLIPWLMYMADATSSVLVGVALFVLVHTIVTGRTGIRRYDRKWDEFMDKHRLGIENNPSPWVHGCCTIHNNGAVSRDFVKSVNCKFCRPQLRANALTPMYGKEEAERILPIEEYERSDYEKN